MEENMEKEKRIKESSQNLGTVPATRRESEPRRSREALLDEFLATFTSDDKDESLDRKMKGKLKN